MSFNDFITLSDRDYQIMKQNYDRILESETTDLIDIYNKMLEQKSNLLKFNADSRYDSIIDKLNSNITELSNIISNNNSNILYSPKSQEIPQIRGLFGHNVHTTQEDGAISPVRSREEIERHNTYLNRDSISPNLPNNNISLPEQNTSTPSPALPNDDNNMRVPGNRPATTTKRNSPMQSSFVSNLIRQFNLNWKKPKKQLIIADNHRNRFHNVGVLHKKNCEPHNMLMGSQIDIIRLLLLYLALRPNCKYLSRIATITNDQFETLLALEEF